jgi:hypothetical protein
MSAIGKICHAESSRGAPWSRYALVVTLVLMVFIAVPATAFADALNPHITSLSSAAVMDGQQLTINGYGFGPAQGGSDHIWFGVAFTYNTGVGAAVASSWSDTQIVVTVPVPTAFGAQNVMVWNGAGAGYYSNQVPLTIMNHLIWVTGVVPKHAAPGATVTLTGWGFGATQLAGKVDMWGGLGFFPAVSAWGDTVVKYLVPAGATPGKHQVCVLNNGGVRSNIVYVSVDPAITLLNPTKGHVGATVTITGTGFGATRGTSKVMFGSKAATKYVSWSATMIKVKVPATTAGTKAVKVVTKAGTSKSKKFKVL